MASPAAARMAMSPRAKGADPRPRAVSGKRGASATEAPGRCVAAGRLLVGGGLLALLNLLHIGVDGFDHLLVGVGLAVDDHLVDAFLRPLDVDGMALQVAVEPAAVPGAEEVRVLLESVSELGAGQRLDVQVALVVGERLEFDLRGRRRGGGEERGKADEAGADAGAAVGRKQGA